LGDIAAADVVNAAAAAAVLCMMFLVLLQDPTEVINKYGADALRLYLINSPVVRAETLRFKEEGVFGVVKDVFLPWYNAYRYCYDNETGAVDRQTDRNAMELVSMACPSVVRGRIIIRQECMYVHQASSPCINECVCRLVRVPLIKWLISYCVMLRPAVGVTCYCLLAGCRFLVQNVLRWELETGQVFVPSLHQQQQQPSSSGSGSSSGESVLDGWIAAATRSLTAFVRSEMEGYRLYTVVPRLVSFIDQLTNIYVRYNRKRLKVRFGGNGVIDVSC
jgi:valyl-tRNA synthetase